MNAELEARRALIARYKGELQQGQEAIAASFASRGDVEQALQARSALVDRLMIGLLDDFALTRHVALCVWDIFSHI